MQIKNFKIPFSVILLTIGILLGASIQKVMSSDSLVENLEKFNNVLTYTKKYYLEEVDTQKLVEAAINGMLNTLDPHTAYIPAKQMESVEEEFKGAFEGIGIEFSVVNDTLTVVSPITGGPSEALGIMAGDRIVKIDGNPVIGISNDDVRKKLRGPGGTKVNVTILRTGVKEALNYEITRDKIPLYSVDTHLMLDEKTGYVTITRFAETTTQELVEALNDLKSKGMTQLVLDLRNNPGGYLNQAAQIADLFIEGRKILVYTKGRRTEFNEQLMSSEPSPYEKIPLVVLVNKGSASASEIVSGAVQDWDRGLVVGETTFGKGLVQRQFTLPDKSALRLTISQYFTPSGRCIQRNYKDKKDKKDYYEDVANRNEKEGDNMEHNTEKDSAKPIYKTNGGRIVYGGGGITPDYIVKAENLTDYSASLLRNNLFYLWVVKYIDAHGPAIKAKYGNDMNGFKKSFNLSEKDVNSFLEFAKEKKIEFKKDQYDKDKEYIVARLKAQIARNFWKNEGWYSVLLGVDNQLEKAVTLFDEAKSLAKLK
jgi:carboxyl-terminal processing protease